MFWTPSDNKVVCLEWATFADNPLKLTTGQRPAKPHLDPNLAPKEPADPAVTSDQEESCIDPDLQLPLASALCFVVAVKLGDFTDEVTVGKQEKLQDQIDHVTKSPPISAAPKTYKDFLKHQEQEGWLKAIQEELQNLF
ncbi:hypothetical protein PCANC_03565 [Puccinia coronata f. sp. avenae]|uniref:Uncharacterized protein n=1 Tax=Puccinia coronata f. sp. avenae TaxID=200324 RepID=A0A2N5VV44_9BASI|nr:hypothetical protein PCANC_03565 [Puccinia coronata f. sp. avenae]